MAYPIGHINFDHCQDIEPLEHIFINYVPFHQGFLIGEDKCPFRSDTQFSVIIIIYKALLQRPFNALPFNNYLSFYEGGLYEINGNRGSNVKVFEKRHYSPGQNFIKYGQNYAAVNKIASPLET